MGRNMKALSWTASRGNSKTGPAVTAWIPNPDPSCEGCPQRAGGCYAQHGTVRHKGLASHVRSLERRGLDRVPLSDALGDAPRRTRIVRVTAIGDPSEATHADACETIATALKERLALVGYMHRRWPEGEPERGWNNGADRAKWSDPVGRFRLMASAESIVSADDAVRAGLRAACVVEPAAPERFTTPEGNRGIVCPAFTRGVQCNDCRLCDPTVGAVPVIGFRAHGPGAKHALAMAGLEVFFAVLQRWARP